MGQGLGNRYTQQIERSVMKDLLAIARGDRAADLLITNVNVMDLVNGEMVKTTIAIGHHIIAGVGPQYAKQDAKRVIDAKGKVAVPGFIDGHLHIESSMMHPFEFERLTLPLGTTSLICDPHEITNVMGDKGFSWFLRCAELAKQNQFIQVSSCVPALPGFETNGADFELKNMKAYRDHDHVLGLAEMMNFPGVINGNDEVLDKVEAFHDLNLDGHCPLVQGRDLDAYLIAGIQNCHETITYEEGKEKLQKGMGLIIREGSVAKNLDTLAPLVTEFNSPQCLLCTDDRNPFEIFHEGHINYLVKKLIRDIKLPLHVAYRLSSYSAAKHFGLRRLGLIAPGKQADIVLLDDAREVVIADVLIRGELVSELELKKELPDKLEQSMPPMENTMKRREVAGQDLALTLDPGAYKCIQIVPGEIITENLTVQFDGQHFDQEDVLPIVVVERYGQESPPSKGLVRGTGLKSGAIASSVAHDSHNIICIGTNPEDMACAVNALIQSGGGFVVVDDDQVKAQLNLPIAGLLSLESAETIADGVKDLKTAFKAQGVVLEEPFIQMAFLALPVIPSLKITDKGLVDVTKFEFTEIQA